MYDLEEANLRLMRNYQETQEGIDWLKNLAAETKQRIETDNSVLAKQQRSLQAEVESENEKSKELSFREGVFEFAGLDKTEQEEFLKLLHEQISHVYHLCVQKSDAPLSSVQLLTDIEVKMINLIQEIRKLPEDHVKQALRAQEKVHRMEVKEERKREQRQHQEERIRKAVERAKAEPKKRTGRPVMTRSEPPRTESKDTKDPGALSEQEEELEFLFG
ncbi:unnamed protein product [Dicrocoelium dendriticum]|nr:unnamed protein product [Dicrocoelium dendriticum]